MLNSDKTQVHEVGWKVNQGLKRTSLEDSAAAIEMEFIDGDAVNTVGIYVVADGVAGQASGEVASRMAVHASIEELVRQLSRLKQSPDSDYADWMELVFENANELIYRQNARMATTLVMAMVIDNKATIANVGDSRAYFISDNDIQQITEDQSVVQQLLNAGVITASETANHPYRNILTHSIGTRQTIKVDTYNVNLKEGDYLLLCSDGLTNEVDNQQIFDIVHESQSVQSACDSLVETANRSGGRDNIAVVLVKIKDHAKSEMV